MLFYLLQITVPHSLSLYYQMQQEVNSKQQQYLFLAYDQLANTQIEQQVQKQPPKNYIKFYKPQNPMNEPSPSGFSVFQDHRFSIDIQRLQQLDQTKQIIVQRISHIFHKHFSPPLFPLKIDQKVRLNKTHKKIYPHFLYQLGHFDVFTFKRLFVTQTMNFQGRYQLLVNNDGRFELQIVDDLVPVYKKDSSSLWQLDIEQPWQLILAKVWAKKLGGYHNIPFAKPFEFIQYFTPSSWKYLNLSKEGRNFISNYYDKVGNTCRILLKTKNQAEVRRCGLLQGVIAYQIIEFIEYTQNNKKQYHLLIQSTSYHSWTGSLSIFDKQFKSVFECLRHNFQFQTAFLINQSDFFNIFSSAYLAPRHRACPQYIDFFSFSRKNSEPFFLKFQLLQKGFFLYNLVQSDQNIQYFDSSQYLNNPHISYQIKKSINELQYFQRYLRVKILLSKESQNLVESQPFKHNISINSIRSAKLQEMSMMFDHILCDFDYQKGHTKGDSHPLILESGKYIMQIYPQEISNYSFYNLQFISREFIRFQPFHLNETQGYTLLCDNLMSIHQKMPCQPLQNEQTGYISFGNEFNGIGFGFLAVILFKRPVGRLCIKVDLQKLQSEGYSIINKSKEEETSKLEIFLQGGQYHIFVLVGESENTKKKWVWPPTAFKYLLFSK